MKRRDFVKTIVASGVLTTTSFFQACANADKRLNILVLGGTYFVGPAIVNAALQNKHNVTLFNRGITNLKMFQELPLIKGDRSKGLSGYEKLADIKWDIVIDVWPEESKLVEDATSFFKERTKHYLFISSIAVYNDFQEVGLHEGSDVVDLNLDQTEWGYAEEKLAAENYVSERFPNRHTILRPGPIKGWRDPALDLLYWIIKMKRDEAIIAPGSGLDPLQFIDVKDIGRIAIKAAEQNLSGTYNCVGPTAENLLWKDFLDLAGQYLLSETKLVWAGEDFLKENKVYSFSDLPLWAPLSEDRGFMQISNTKLMNTGFQFTPVTKTLDDCMKWHRKQNKTEFKFGTEDVELGLERSRELKLIESLTS